MEAAVIPGLALLNKMLDAEPAQTVTSEHEANDVTDNARKHQVTHTRHFKFEGDVTDKTVEEDSKKETKTTTHKRKWGCFGRCKKPKPG